MSFQEMGLIYPGPPAVVALHDCTLDISRGDYMAIVGPSGSGKSSFLNIAGLLDRPTHGKYMFGGRDTATMSERQRTELRGRSIGFVFQAFHLLPHRDVCENVELAQIYAGIPRSDRRQRATETLKRVGLGHRLGSLARTLSGGEKQRVAIARALVNSPMVLLCDEPTGNLDSANADEVMRLIDQLHAEGQTTIVITHDADVARRAKRGARIRDGLLTETDPGQSE